MKAKRGLPSIKHVPPFGAYFLMLSDGGTEIVFIEYDEEYSCGTVANINRRVACTGERLPTPTTADHDDYRDCMFMPLPSLAHVHPLPHKGYHQGPHRHTQDAIGFHPTRR